MYPAPHSRPPRTRAAPSTPARRRQIGLTLAIAFVLAIGALASLPTPALAQVSANVSGVVTDGTLPIAGATVEFKRPVAGNYYDLRTAKTGPEGKYAISGLDTGEWTVTGRLDGYRTNESKVTLAAGARTLDISLRSLFAFTYTVTVRDQAGTALQGTLLTLRGGNDQASGERTATTDAQGSASLLLFSGSNNIEFTKRGFERYYDYVWNPTADVTREVNLAEAPVQTATIRGTVIDAVTGAPVQAWIDLSTDWSREQSASSSGSSSGSTEPAMVAPTAEPAPASEPQAISVSRPYYHGNYNSTATAPDGTFTMKAYPGAITLSANRRGYLVEQTSKVIEDGATWDVTFQLKALPARDVVIKGIVTDQATGKAIPGAQVSIQVHDSGDSQWLTTDDQGRYEVKVRPGYTTVEVSYWGKQIYYYEAAVADCAPDSDCIRSEPPRAEGPDKEFHPRVTTFTTTAGQSKDLTHALKARPDPSSTVLGYVIDAKTQKAIPNAQVSIQNHDNNDWGNAQADGTGSYKFNLYGGYHTISVWMDGYLPVRMNLQVPADGAVRQDLVMTPGQYVSEGWWSPDQSRGGDCCYAYETTASEGSYAPGAPMPASDSATASSPASADGKNSQAGGSSGSSGAVRGFGGGLPPYDPQNADDTFGNGAVKESPMPLAFLFVMAIGAMALVGGLRRRDL